MLPQQLAVVPDCVADRRDDHALGQRLRSVKLEQQLDRLGGLAIGAVDRRVAGQVEPGEVGELPARAPLELR